MKRIVIFLLVALSLLPSCKKEDVFALWRDPSYLVIQSDATNFVTMMQYNIWGANSPWDSERFDRVAAVINSQKPDFVSLNEVDSLTTRNPWFMCRELATRTGMYYAFAKAREPYSLHWNQPGAYGDAILSRHPILEVKRFKLYPDPAQGETDKEDRSVCAIRVNVNGTSLWIATTHLDHRGVEMSRIYQARNLKPIVDQLAGSLILCGDLNAVPTSETMKIVFTYLTPQYPSYTSQYYTYPSIYNGQANPTSLIDYIMLKPDEQKLECVSYRVVNSPASDHCAVVATFKMKD